MRWKTIERHWLYDAVWSKAVSAVADDIGISGRGLGKVCERMGVPRPPRGYWAKVHAGQKPLRTPLRRPKKGVPSSVEVRITENLRPKSRTSVPDIAIVQSPQHPLVERSRKHLKKMKLDERGIGWCPSSKCLAIRVAPASVERSLAIFGALLGTLEDRGHAVRIERVESRHERSDAYRTVAYVAEQPVQPHLQERSKRVDHVPTEPELKRAKALGLF